MELERYKWKNIAPEIQSRALDTFLFKEEVIINFEVRLIKGKNRTLYEVERKINQIKDLASELVTNHSTDEIDLTLDMVNDLEKYTDKKCLDGDSTDETSIEEWLNRATLSVLSILDKLSLFTTETSIKFIGNFFNQDFCALTKSTLFINKRIEGLKDDIDQVPGSDNGAKRGSWASKLFRRLSYQSPKENSGTETHSETFDSGSDNPEPCLQRSKTEVNINSLHRLALKQANAKDKAQSSPDIPSPTSSAEVLSDEEQAPHHISVNKHQTSLGFFSRMSPLRLTRQFSPKVTPDKEIKSGYFDLSNTSDKTLTTSPYTSESEPPSPGLLKSRPSVKSVSRTLSIKNRLSRRKTLGKTPHFDNEATVELIIKLDEGSDPNSEVKLTIGKDISLNRLIRGIRSKVILSGLELAPIESLSIYYFRDDEKVILVEDSLGFFFKDPTLEKKVWICTSQEKDRFSWLNLESSNVENLTPPNSKGRNRLSSNYNGLDLASMSKSDAGNNNLLKVPQVYVPPVKKGPRSRKFDTSMEIRDYLQTPACVKAENIMSNDLWGTAPKLNLSLSTISSSESSNANSPTQLSPTFQTPNSSGTPSLLTDRSLYLDSFDYKYDITPIIINDISGLKHDQEILNRKMNRETFRPRPKTIGMSRKKTLPAHLEKYTHPLQRQHSAPVAQEKARSGSKAQGHINSINITQLMLNHQINSEHRVKVTIAINKDYMVKLELEVRSANYTSIMNRVITKFSKAGYPLAKLSKMDFTYFLPTPNQPQSDEEVESILIINDTHSLKKLLTNAKSQGLNSLSLLMVPKILLGNTRSRFGIRWDNPMNLAKLNKPIKS